MLLAGNRRKAPQTWTRGGSRARKSTISPLCGFSLKLWDTSSYLAPALIMTRGAVSSFSSISQVCKGLPTRERRRGTAWRPA
eukprot:8678393-Pyramimonas_sp.AAC.1